MRTHFKNLFKERITVLILNILDMSTKVWMKANIVPKNFIFYAYLALMTYFYQYLPQSGNLLATIFRKILQINKILLAIIL